MQYKLRAARPCSTTAHPPCLGAGAGDETSRQIPRLAYTLQNADCRLGCSTPSPQVNSWSVVKEYTYDGPLSSTEMVVCTIALLLAEIDLRGTPYRQALAKKGTYNTGPLEAERRCHGQGAKTLEEAAVGSVRFGPGGPTCKSPSLSVYPSIQGTTYVYSSVVYAEGELGATRAGHATSQRLREGSRPASQPSMRQTDRPPHAHDSILPRSSVRSISPSSPLTHRPRVLGFKTKSLARVGTTPTLATEPALASGEQTKTPSSRNTTPSPVPRPPSPLQTGPAERNPLRLSYPSRPPNPGLPSSKQKPLAAEVVGPTIKHPRYPPAPNLMESTFGLGMRMMKDDGWVHTRSS
ncbi:hypothetical protein MBM_01494 [Drepanopeziza brunnea f. sp. 'multigermtubi' MB_m1]|uniref:Uncharacterized protein n=1 Tax=Marssonina brunnea f. sp. multigermtubi (strain MB_m1) TaxID=1072389 RepID=K1X6T3_MARBU|nr:uncharacterized protein MBM_01494 [Drepanopeziza brunnea f. sp. 'multigermtubi' MB_m1]EKD20812.1 hypothetical protein MBM_01494 [Drepanopeziza brunnea f. sp. 'multigermtubi' MB_m1]